MNENAAITYNPYADSQGGDQTQANFENACQQLMNMSSVEAVGRGESPDGGDAIVVYVRDQQSLSQLPAMLSGMRVIGHVTGEVKAL
jgi:hypothetical protein